MKRSARHAAPGSAAGRALAILLLVLVLLGAGAGGVYLWATGSSGPSRPLTLEVPEGATAADVGRLLDEAGVIRSAMAFRVAARLRGAGVSIRAGRYAFQTNMELREALGVLEAGPLVETVRVTIPEGLRAEQVAERLARALPFDADTFLETAASGGYSLPPYLPAPAPGLEGFLFPETYDLGAEATPEEVIRRLLDQFGWEVGALDWGRAEELGLAPYEVVIVASLVEREARVERDRGRIASVIYNRLRKGMLLQIDATVEYALPEHKTRLAYEDYEYPSPYNTYLHAGLPPTPIASPGLASIEAALHPAKTRFLYYLVVDPGTGRHGFAKTYREFLALKARVQAGA